MKLRFVDWIWRIRGSLPIDPAQSTSDAFGRLDGLLREKNTTSRVQGDTLTFTKKGQLPQDKMSVFDGGTLQIADGVLRYDLMSRALLACFLAPLLFFALGHVGVAFDEWRNPPEVVKAKAEAAKRRSRIKAEDVPMSAVDTFLHAPQPEKKKGAEEIGKRKRKPSMKTAYVFMSLFFGWWIVGRILEQVLVHSRFRRLLAGDDVPSPSDAADRIGDPSVRNVHV